MFSTTCVLELYIFKILICVLIAVNISLCSKDKKVRFRLKTNNFPGIVMSSLLRDNKLLQVCQTMLSLFV